MNLKKTITTTVLAASIALGAAGTPLDAFAGAQSGNTSETNTGHGITRTSRSQGQETLRGEGEWAWVNYSTYDLLMVTRIDMETESSAELAIDLSINGGLLEDSGFDVDGTFRIRDIDGCEGVNVSIDGMDAYIVLCQDGEFVNMVLGTDKQDALDTAETMQDGYEPEAPRGYQDFEG